MFEVFKEEKVITACMLVCMVFSIFLRVFLGMLYQRMIREADNMAATENKLLKQCKLKFANCFELSGGVSNIPVFVDKFLNRLSLGHMSFELMYHLSGQTMLLSVVFSGIGVCRSILKGRTLGDILPFYIISFLGLYVYFSVSTVVNIKGKRRVLKINLVDYLENHLSPRIDVTRQDLEMLYGDAAYREAGGTVTRLDAGKRKRIGTASVGRKERRTVELMPISGRAVQTSERKNAEESEAARQQPSSQVTEEELEALLKEFLAT